MDPEVLQKLAERKIQEAIEEGQFENLPGKGKPIVFDDDPMTPPHLRMMNKVLKNANVLPDWMQTQKDLISERKEIPALRARLAKENQKRRVRVAALPADHAAVREFVAWHTKSRAAYLRRLKDFNTLILKLNMMAPSTVQPGSPLKVEAEMEAFDADFPALETQSTPTTLPETPRESGGLRGIARARYQEGHAGPVGGWIKTARLQERVGGSAGDLDTEDIRTADAPDPNA